MHIRATISFAITSVCLLTCASCGSKGDRPEIGTVEGTVLMDGVPLSGAQVMYFPEDGRMSQGETDERGHYVLGYLPQVPGAKLGRHQVQITTAVRHIGEDGPPTVTPERVPRKYNLDSTLTAEVLGGTNVFDFSIEGKRHAK